MATPKQSASSLAAQNAVQKSMGRSIAPKVLDSRDPVITGRVPPGAVRAGVAPMGRPTPAPVRPSPMGRVGIPRAPIGRGVKR